MDILVSEVGLGTGPDFNTVHSPVLMEIEG